MQYLQCDPPPLTVGSPRDGHLLKGSVLRDFWAPFFHDLNPSRPLINMLKYFRIRFRFRWYIRILKKLRGVHHTAESSTSVCIISLSQAPRCTSHHRVKWFLTNSAVCIPPRAELRAVHYTSGSDSTVWCTLHNAHTLPSVCFDQKFYKCYFSVMPEDINVKIIP